MNRLNRPILCGVLLLIAQHSLISQVPPPITCNASAAAPPVVRAEGRAELVSDIVLTCTGGNPTMAAPVNISIFLNTNITSNLTGPGPDETEALTLIDEPMPSPALNMSNGFAFVGQVKGTPGVIPSGNVFTGLRTGVAESSDFSRGSGGSAGRGNAEVPDYESARATAAAGARGRRPSMAFVSISGPIAIPITNPVLTVGFVSNGLNFSHFPMGQQSESEVRRDVSQRLQETDRERRRDR